jgi:photosystem II stability/assembly factor-like uncharacterized protein
VRDVSPLIYALLLLVSGVWTPQPSGSDSELRGVGVLDATHAWASGSGGTVLRTQDGAHWDKLVVPGGETLDFRDLEALDEKTVILMSAGTGDAARIFRSSDGGVTWTLAHTNPDKDGFYDAMAFWDAKNGIVMGDPVGGRFVVRVTDDGGATWAAPHALAMPEALPGEGAFAASGTCLFAVKGGADAVFVTGGAKVARIFHTRDGGRSWTAAPTPAPAGNASSGLFSVAFLDPKRGFAAGGDYKQPAFAGLNGIRTEDGGATWTPAPLSATGFYSGVVPVPGSKEDLVAVGLAGSALSHDGGRTWTRWGDAPLNAVAFSDSRTGWAVGPKGAIVKFSSNSR